MENNTGSPRLILASQSPRRQYMLRQAGLSFEVVLPEVDEGAISLSLAPLDYVKTLAGMKARQVAERFPKSFVVGADTIVVIEDRILGKPGTPEEAKRMLRSLGGKTHQVITGYAVVCERRRHLHVSAEVTDVVFKTLNEAEIDWYIRTGEPFDKAGAYAIQGIGTFLVKRIDGSFTNVVGLPVCELVTYLIEIGVVGADMADRLLPGEPSDWAWI